jgi:ABC-type sugar transport system ATPase subunit
MLVEPAAVSSRRSFASVEPRSVLSVRGVRKRYGAREALAGLDLAVEAGEPAVVVGPSGAGKSTLLRVLAGLDRPEAGTLTLDGLDLARVPAERRGMHLVFQENALFPHFTVEENLLFAMRSRRGGRSIAEAAELCGIAPLLQRRPSRLSGGERQLAALARAFVANPRAVLLDEPFAHLDPPLRAQMLERLSALRGRLAGISIHVTHDHQEAMRLGGRLIVLIDGAVAQAGSPQDVYDRPATLAIARFFGTPAMNLIGRGGEIHGVRPDALVIGAGERSGTVLETFTTGADRYLRIRADGEVLLARVTSGLPLPQGSTVAWGYDVRRVPRYDAGTGRLLP